MFYGTGLIPPFEIIYLHTVRGFSTATAGLVLATVMGTAGTVSPSVRSSIVSVRNGS